MQVLKQPVGWKILGLPIFGNIRKVWKAGKKKDFLQQLAAASKIDP